MTKIKIRTPLDKEKVKTLYAGQNVLISGIIYTARDAAHKRIVEMMEKKEPLPFDLSNQIIYYVGPCPPKPGQVIGSAGPTTSGRMDSFAPALIKKGLRGMIGKGSRSEEVVKTMVEYGAVYFGAVGGAGALISKVIKSQELIAFPDLGAEAVRRLFVEDFPAVVLIDSTGKDLYKTARERYGKRGQIEPRA